ncbi:hypothetical protein ACIRNY_10975 [Capnocytophaga canimorsus]|uniref:hypothetical protein n=1 Tax=Capnocytophaga canimorsus TaxID=28188 RepID=UPI00385133A9
METLKDIFVSYEIAQKLKEIGFDEPCIGAYDCYCMLHTINSNDKFSLSKNEIFAYAPTWEQVKTWFREKGYFSTIKINPYAFYYGSIGMHTTIDLAQEDTYQQAREALILKLIEIYKNGK